MKIWTVDAFTKDAYQGNPAAVMVVDDFPIRAQAIAAEMNLSETVFLKPLQENRYHIRWFTPDVEVDLCGHATLAGCHVLFHHLKIPFDEVRLQSLSGDLLVQKEGASSYTLNFPRQDVSDLLDPAPFKAIFPKVRLEEVRKAHDDIIVLCAHEDEVRGALPDFVALQKIEARGVILTSPGGHYDFVSRFFAPKVGVPEDPVTGSAHCKLVPYWAARLGKDTLTAYQASKRGGVLSLRLDEDRVFITGDAVTVMEGTWLGPLS